MGKRYIVDAEYVIVSTADPASGTRVKLGFYMGALLPPDMTEAEIEHHLGTRQIKEVTVSKDGEIKAAPEDVENLRQTAPATVTDGLGDPNQMPATPDGDGDSSGDGGPGEIKAGDDVPEPRKNAERADWVNYAVSKGADRDEIEANEVSRADLIATYGTPR